MKSKEAPGTKPESGKGVSRKETPTLQVRKRPRLASGVALQWQQLGALLRKHTLVRQVLAGG